MEFVKYEDAIALLREQGIAERPDGEDRLYLEVGDDAREVVHLHLTADAASCPPREGARVFEVAPEGLPGAVDHLIHRLHLNQVLLIPVGKWRRVFDVVAFSLAENEDWQEIDATASVELNTRDPLLCEPGDFQTLNALLSALLSDADNPDQGLMLTTTAAPVIVELVPEGAVRISIGNAVLADEVAEALNT